MTKSRLSTCKARQYSDQMSCACGLGWDIGDPDPPECRNIVVANQELKAMRSTLAEPKTWALKKKGLLILQEMPLRSLPTHSVPEGLYQVVWPSMPEACFVAVDIPDGHMATIQGRDYRFFDVKGHTYLDVKRRECHTDQRFTYRYHGGEWAHE